MQKQTVAWQTSYYTKITESLSTMKLRYDSNATKTGIFNPH